MTATLFFVTNIVVLYNAYNREPQTWFCVIRQISRISKSGVFKGGISPSGLSPLALYADYPFIIRSYAIYIGQEKPPDGTSYFPSGDGTVPPAAETTAYPVCDSSAGNDCFFDFLCGFKRKRGIYTAGGGHVSDLFVCGCDRICL